MYQKKTSWTPKNLFKRGQKGLWWQFAKTSGLYQDSTATTPLTAAAQPVGFFPDLSNNGIHGTQATSTARPTYQISPSRVTIDKVDDAISFTVPAGGIIGTMIYSTTWGTLAHGINLPAGTYTVGGLYAPVVDIVGIIIREGEMSCAEIERCYTYFKSIGGGPYGVNAYKGQTNISNNFRGTVSGNIFAKVTSVSYFNTNHVTNFISTFRGMTSLVALPRISVASATSMAGLCDGNSALTTVEAGMFNDTSCTNYSTAFTGCALTQTSVDNILVSIELAGTSNGTLNMTGGTSSTPSAIGLAAKTFLQARGWTVTNN